MNDTLEEFINELRNSLPVPSLPKRVVFERPVGALYNIHKRSMPIGVDKIIVIGLTRTEADVELLRLIHREAKRRENEGLEIVYYFDLVPIDANKTEQSIYFNEGRITI